MINQERKSTTETITYHDALRSMAVDILMRHLFLFKLANAKSINLGAAQAPCGSAGLSIDFVQRRGREWAGVLFRVSDVAEQALSQNAILLKEAPFLRQGGRPTMTYPPARRLG